MTTNTSGTFDVAIVGLGVAGAICLNKLSSQHKNMKILAIEAGRKMGKRRQQMWGWLGMLPNSDGKFYCNDINKVADIVSLRKAKSANTYFNNLLKQIDDFSIIKDRSPSISLDKKIKKNGYILSLNDYTQMYPKQIHMLSKHIANTIENNHNITFSFDNEAIRIVKQKHTFIITTEEKEYKAKKIIIAVGRSGWRWANELYKSLGIIENNDIARFGIRIEANSNVLKDFNKSNCSLFKNDDSLEIGPLSWYGSIIPEDHYNMALAAFRGNEARWKTDKVSFQFIGNRHFPSAGFEQVDRIAQLTFILANDRIVKERVSSLLSGRSKLSIMPEYNWLKESLMDFAKVVPEILTKAYFHLPTIIPLCSQINVGKNLETDIDNMWVIGESAGTTGLLAAALMGIIVSEEVCK